MKFVQRVLELLGFARRSTDALVLSDLARKAAILDELVRLEAESYIADLKADPITAGLAKRLEARIVSDPDFFGGSPPASLPPSEPEAVNTRQLPEPPRTDQEMVTEPTENGRQDTPIPPTEKRRAGRPLGARDSQPRKRRPTDGNNDTAN